MSEAVDLDLVVQALLANDVRLRDVVAKAALTAGSATTPVTTRLD